MSELRVTLLPQLVLLEIELDLPRRIGEMRKCRFSVGSPRDDAARQAHRRPLLCLSEKCLCLRRRVLPLVRIRIRRYTRGLESLQLLSSRLEDEVELFAHAAAVFEPPPSFRYAAMKGSIPPSMTF